MSEERKLNEVEALLRQLTPAPLDVNRDVLLFEAGRAAANRGRVGRFVWPAIAASLLLACGGLGIALQKKSSALDAALAANAREPSIERGVVSNRPPAPQRSGGELVLSESRVAGANRRAGFAPSRDVDELFGHEPARGSRLTALGWVDGPPTDRVQAEPGQEGSAETAEPPLRQIRRGDSWELLRALGG